MTPDDIIKSGLAAMADDPTFRAWTCDFKCVQDAKSVSIEWVNVNDEHRYPETQAGSLAELAFELRDKADEHTMSQFEGAMLMTACRYMKWDEGECLYSSIHTWMLFHARPEHWIISAIAALEGE